MERAEIEDNLETALDGFGIEEAWRVAPLLAEAGYRADDLDLQGATAAAVVEAMASRSEVDALIAEVAEGSRRLSELVAALKSYSYLDQAPVQNVDVARGIEDTLLILKSKTSDLDADRATTNPTCRRFRPTGADSIKCGPISSTTQPTRSTMPGSRMAGSPSRHRLSMTPSWSWSRTTDPRSRSRSGTASSRPSSRQRNRARHRPGSRHGL